MNYEEAKLLILKKFNTRCSKYFYIKIVNELNEKRAIPYIKENLKLCIDKEKGYKNKKPGYHACNFTSEIKLCKETIKKLKRL